MTVVRPAAVPPFYDDLFVKAASPSFLSVMCRIAVASLWSSVVGTVVPHHLLSVGALRRADLILHALDTRSGDLDAMSPIY